MDFTSAYVTERKRKVVHGESSTEMTIECGVPQATVLGPRLFLSYGNDIGEDVTSNKRLYSDECVLYAASETDKLSNLTRRGSWTEIQFSRCILILK